MALQGHKDPNVSKVYTEAADRRRLAESAMRRFDMGGLLECGSQQESHHA